MKVPLRRWMHGKRNWRNSGNAWCVHPSLFPNFSHVWAICDEHANANGQRSSAQANRASVVEESAKSKITAREVARMERQRKLAETLRQKADAEDRGEDVERQKNWEYTIEENDEWEKKLARKARRADFSFNGV